MSVTRLRVQQFQTKLGDSPGKQGSDLLTGSVLIWTYGSRSRSIWLPGHTMEVGGGQSLPNLVVWICGVKQGSELRRLPAC